MQSDIESQVSGFFAFSDPGSLVSTIIDAMIVIAAIASLLFLVLGGVSWITSGGDKQKIESAQKQITNAIIGLIIVVASFAIFFFIKTFLGLDTAIIINQ